MEVPAAKYHRGWDNGKLGLFPSLAPRNCFPQLLSPTPLGGREGQGAGRQNGSYVTGLCPSRENVLRNLADKAFDRPICEALLDQRFFNGIGNYLRAEILYRSAGRPWA